MVNPVSLSNKSSECSTPNLETDGTETREKRRKTEEKDNDTDLLDAANAVEDLDSMRMEPPNFDDM